MSPLWSYIGMSANLRQRFEGHERASSQMMRKLDEYLRGEDAWLRVSVQRDQSISHAGGLAEVDLTSALTRLLFEHAAIADYRLRHPEASMVNLDGRRRTEGVEPPEPEDFASDSMDW